MGNEAFPYSSGAVSPGFDELNIGDNIGTGIVFQSVTGATSGGGVRYIGYDNVNLAWHNHLKISDGRKGSYIVPTNDPSPDYVGRVATSSKLAALNTHRNGPYGFSSWQQIRISENPLSRHHRKNNTMTFVRTPGRGRNVSTDGTLRVRDRYSSIFSFTESVVTQKAHPLVWNVGRHFKDEDGNVDMENPHRFSIISSYGNMQIAFANDAVSRHHKFDPDEEKTEYVAIKDMYLENGLNKLDSPLTHWEFIQYRETIFPKAARQYVNQTRQRPNF